MALHPVQMQHPLFTQHNRPDPRVRYFVLDLWLTSPRRKRCTVDVPPSHAVLSKNQSSCMYTRITSDSKYVNICIYIYYIYTVLFEIIVGVLTTCHLGLQMQPHVISFYGVTSRIRFMFLLFPQVSRNWRYESESPLKPSPLTCYKQFGTNSIIVLMFVESQRAHI